MKALFKMLTPAILCVFACSEPDAPQQTTTSQGGEPNSVTNARSNARGYPKEHSISYYNDWSGQVHTIVKSQPFGNGSNPNNFNQPLTVPADYVLVGGGVYTELTDANGGGYITSSYPTGIQESSGWIGASKDHKVVDAHSIRVFAIGLKIDGVSPATLRSNMKYDYSYMSSPATTFPSNSKTVPVGMKIIGGGAQIDYTGWPGNLLVESYPDGGIGWSCLAKDHYYQSFGGIKAYVIGINDYIPGFGYIDIQYNSFPYAQLTCPSGNCYLNVSQQSGWVTTCVGARSTYDNGKGRLLGGFRPDYTESPNTYQAGAKNKDLHYVDTGVLYFYAIQIRKRP